MRAKGMAEAEAIKARADALAENQDAVIGQQLAENWPAIVEAAAKPFGDIDQMIVLNGAQGLSQALARAQLRASPACSSPAPCSGGQGKDPHAEKPRPRTPPRPSPHVGTATPSRPRRLPAPLLGTEPRQGHISVPRNRMVGSQKDRSTMFLGSEPSRLDRSTFLGALPGTPTGSSWPWRSPASSAGSIGAAYVAALTQLRKRAVARPTGHAAPTGCSSWPWAGRSPPRAPARRHGRRRAAGRQHPRVGRRRRPAPAAPSLIPVSLLCIAVGRRHRPRGAAGADDRHASASWTGARFGLDADRACASSPSPAWPPGSPCCSARRSAPPSSPSRSCTAGPRVLRGADARRARVARRLRASTSSSPGRASSRCGSFRRSVPLHGRRPRVGSSPAASAGAVVAVRLHRT